MKELKDQFNNTDTLHHAYALVGERAKLLAELREFLEKSLGLSLTGNPDVLIQEFESFGVDESRALGEAQTRTPLAGGWKIFVVVFSGATVEAQNALLKILEEPTSGTHFFLILPSAELLLPTLRSRVEVIECGGESEAGINIETFLKATPAGRAKLIKPLIDAKDKQRAIDFLNALERSFYLARPAREFSANDIFIFEEIDRSRMYLSDRAPSVKLLLEHVAAIL